MSSTPSTQSKRKEKAGKTAAQRAGRGPRVSMRTPKASAQTGTSTTSTTSQATTTKRTAAAPRVTPAPKTRTPKATAAPRATRPAQPQTQPQSVPTGPQTSTSTFRTAPLGAMPSVAIALPRMEPIFQDTNSCRSEFSALSPEEQAVICNVVQQTENNLNEMVEAIETYAKKLVFEHKALKKQLQDARDAAALQAATGEVSPGLEAQIKQLQDQLTTKNAELLSLQAKLENYKKLPGVMGQYNTYFQRLIDAIKAAQTPAAAPQAPPVAAQTPAPAPALQVPAPALAPQVPPVAAQTTAPTQVPAPQPEEPPVSVGVEDRSIPSNMGLDFERRKLIRKSRRPVKVSRIAKRLPRQPRATTEASTVVEERTSTASTVAPPIFTPMRTTPSTATKTARKRPLEPSRYEQKTKVPEGRNLKPAPFANRRSS